MEQENNKFLSEKEVNQLSSYIKNQADRARKRGTSRAVIDELIVLLLLNTGLRPTELCNLQIQDLPISHGEQVIIIRDPNQEINRKIMIPKELISLISRFATLYINNNQPEAFLFMSERGNPFSYFSLYNKIRKIGIESGIGDLSPAVLRHTFIVNLYNKEKDLRYVQQQAGYATCRALHKYITDNKSDFNQICEACEKKIESDSGIRIESGQLICNKCYNEFFSS